VPALWAAVVINIGRKRTLAAISIAERFVKAFVELKLIDELDHQDAVLAVRRPASPARPGHRC
jgi:hypothetical protein